MDKEGQQVPEEPTIKENATTPEEPVAEKEAPEEEKPINEALSSEMDALLDNDTQTPEAPETSASETTQPTPVETPKPEEPEAQKSEEPPKNAPKPKNANKKKISKKLIIIIIVAIIIIASAITCFLLLQKPEEKSTNTNKPSTSFEDIREKYAPKNCASRDSKDYFTLTKEEAYDFASQRTEESFNCVRAYLSGNDDDFYVEAKDDFILLYSYSDISDVQDIIDSYDYCIMQYYGCYDDYDDEEEGEEKAKIEYDIIEKDHYAIVRNKTRDDCTHKNLCMIGISFDKKYFDYSQTNSKKRRYLSSGTQKIMKSRDEEWMKKALNLLLLSDDDLRTYPDYIYSTNLVFDGTNYIYQGLNIAVRYDSDIVPIEKGIYYALQLYYNNILINAKTGEVEEADQSHYYGDLLNSFPLTKKESNALS